MSVTIEVSRGLPYPIDRAWTQLADLASHVDWMRDAESIRFLSESHQGVGTVMLCRTRVGPLVTNDRLEVVAWEEGRAIAVRHTGLVGGDGELRLDPEGPSSCRLQWRETLVFPRLAVGPLTERVAAAVLARIWHGNLARFEARLARDGAA